PRPREPHHPARPEAEVVGHLLPPDLPPLVGARRRDDAPLLAERGRERGQARDRLGAGVDRSALAVVGPVRHQTPLEEREPHFAGSALGATTATSCEGATLYRAARAGGCSSPKWAATSSGSAWRVNRPHMATTPVVFRALSRVLSSAWGQGIEGRAGALCRTRRATDSTDTPVTGACAADSASGPRPRPSGRR